ncbi:MAG: aminopeptidase P family protein [Rhodobacteraceae bacterium]|nr:aminopeptidase P family protein [Paracoccaceae bacterium]
MIDRRTMISGAGLGAAVTVVAGAQSQSIAPAFAASGKVTPVTAVDVPEAFMGPRMNFEQAEKVMTKLGLDALVVGSGTNFYHATGIDLTATRMGHAPGAYAIITRDDKQRLSVVSQSFMYYYTIAQDHIHANYPVYIYTAPTGDGSVEGIGRTALPAEGFRDRGEAPMDEVEVFRAKALADAVTNKGTEPGLMFAVRKALNDVGVSKGRIAVDLQPVWRTVAEAAPDATIVDADDALRRIRPIKSELEVKLMRYAAQLNCEAALEAVQTVRAGGDVRDLRAAYFAAAARRGGRGVFMVINRVSSPNYEAKFHDGQCFSIDCVSEFMGYHGDYARSVFVGEPPANMKKVTTAAAKSWDAIREILKPGVSFSQIRAKGKETLKKMGVDYNISFTPHSVGLYHNDAAGSSGLSSAGDTVLEKNFILSVDCPLLEAGAGGSHHLEDLTLFTADGSEQINDIGNRTITV